MDKTQYHSAEEYVRATCLGKLESLPLSDSANTIQVACDTVVVRPDDGKILEKPSSLAEAFSMLKSLLGKRIRVVSVVHLRQGSRIESFHEESELLMRNYGEEITDKDIYGYLEDVNYR